MSNEKSEVKITNHRSGLEVKARNFDGHFKAIVRREFKEAIEKIVYEFTQECEVALRKLKPGETVVVSAAPISATLVADDEELPVAPDEESTKLIEHQSA